MELSEAERREYEQLRAARSQITENESDGWGHCRYCNAEELPYDKAGGLITESDVSHADCFRATHEEWCPSAILDKIQSAIVAVWNSEARGKQ